MPCRTVPLTVAIMLSIGTLPASADETEDPTAPLLENLEEHTEELSEQALAAIERFATMIGIAIDQLPTFFQNLPRYKAPEVLPNGDIIIRRVPDALPGAPGKDGSVETGGTDT